MVLTQQRSNRGKPYLGESTADQPAAEAHPHRTPMVSGDLDLLPMGSFTEI